MTGQRVGRRRWPLALGATAVVAVAAALAAMPWLYAEFGMPWDGARVGPMPAVSITGRVVDDYYVVQQLDSQTFAIGEPRYYQGNYSYLILGDRRAVLFDGGPAQRDIVPLVRSLTSLPVTVIASHLHYDHVGALGRLDRTAMVDLPELRRNVDADGWFRFGRYDFLGYLDALPAPGVRIDDWWAPDARIDLGGRELTVLHLPGHTATSVALLDANRRQLFAGDFIYPSMLYAFLPGASRHAYLASVRKLLLRLPADASIYAAHMAAPEHGVTAPTVTRADLEALERTLVDIEQGRARAKGVYPRVYPVRGEIVFATGFPWNDQ